MSIDGTGPIDFFRNFVKSAVRGTAESNQAIAKTGPGAKFRPPEGELFISASNRGLGVDLARVELNKKSGLSDDTHSTGSSRGRRALLDGLHAAAGRTDLDTAA